MGEGVRRREILGLAAGAVTAAGGAVAQTVGPATADAARAAMAHFFETGPGVPVVTPVIETAAGKVQGLVHGGISTFLGIRYGAAPIGPLRWRAPQKPKPWTTVADCSAYGAPAMQMASGTIAAPVSDFGMQMDQVFTTPSELKIQNEDCLFLNVWTPGCDGQKRPVMVWIHGGGFAFGSGSQPIYDCEGLARHGDVVAVSMNHRLNAFGYLYLGDLMGPDYAASGNLGMLDLVACLEWVRDNIAAFGGDPGNVTIMGQSGGGAKVSALMAMPAARGLFHKASIQSGPGLKVGRKDAATAGARKVLAELGVAPGDIKALQAAPAQTLLAAVDAVNARMPSFGMGPPAGIPLEPIVDGGALPRDPFDPDAPAVSADVPLLIGFVKDEMTIFLASEPWFGRMTEADLAKMTAPFGAKGKALIDALRAIDPSYSPSYLFAGAISSNFAMAGSVRLAERKAAQAAAGGAPVYMWNLNWETPVDHGVFKTPHTMEIPFMLYSFDKVRAFVGPGPQPKRMADQLCGAWVAFARTGRPDGPLTPHWPPYDAGRRATMVFNLESKVVDDPNAAVRKIVAG